MMYDKTLSLLCSRIDRSAAYSFWLVCLSVRSSVHLSVYLSAENLTLAIAFER